MFRELMPAMVTPFDERGEVDLGAAEAVVERFIEAGVDGISPLGSTGEFSHLTSDERKRLAEEVDRIVAGRVPLVIGVGAASTKEMVELARHAESVGADAVLSSCRLSTGRWERRPSSGTSRPWPSRSVSRSWYPGRDLQPP